MHLVTGPGRGVSFRGLIGDGDSALTDEVTSATLADLFELTPRRVEQLAKEGHIPKATRGVYPLDACCCAYIRYLKELANRRVAGAFD
jgi:phage terminase Nu1 subunit (DNA packaging protein)